MTIQYKEFTIYDLSFGWKIKGVDIVFPTLEEVFDFLKEK